MADKIYYTAAQAKASANYQKNFDNIHIRVPKGTKARYASMAEAAGKSLNRFIIDCIEQSPESEVR